MNMRIQFLLVPVVAVLLSGCTTPEVQYAADTTAYAPVYCFDTVGHSPGAKPFILGGTCCCTPTKELMDKYHADGILKEMELKDLFALYEQKGIKTAMDHKNCNNLCEWGPHVVKGGHCMVPPTPATFNFEEVRLGVKHVFVRSDKK